MGHYAGYNWMYDAAIVTCFMFTFGAIGYIADTINKHKAKRLPRAQATRV